MCAGKHGLLCPGLMVKAGALALAFGVLQQTGFSKLLKEANSESDLPGSPGGPGDALTLQEPPAPQGWNLWGGNCQGLGPLLQAPRRTVLKACARPPTRSPEGWELAA